MARQIEAWKYEKNVIAALPSSSYGAKRSSADMRRWAKVSQREGLNKNTRDSQINIIQLFDRHVSFPISVYNLGELEEKGIKAKPLYQVTEADRDWWNKEFDRRDSLSNTGKRKRNGIFEDSAEDLAVGFHGRASQETFEVEERRNFRQDLAMLGELEELEVFNELAWNETGELKTFTFSRKKKDLVRLAGSPDRRQLFLVGGDQEIPDSVLGDLAGDRQATKDKVSLGFVYSISYWSDKHHLEGSNGVMEAYMHCFGESTFENPDARQDGQADYLVFMPEQKLGAGLLPELVYDRLNMTLELVGGGYEIRDEGIWD